MESLLILVKEIKSFEKITKYCNTFQKCFQIYENG